MKTVSDCLQKRDSGSKIQHPSRRFSEERKHHFMDHKVVTLNVKPYRHSEANL